ncbi:hypothetical protein RHMOL_Rhmol10G0285000 [Rhododendron molle]|uniref:Uncharacterized protein n=1 Tax=Rhododendron molle TaxID=49168 RepID=A0ACC0M873_RHOML|nr:hypothetical protein RHMOL_Rhmol10G0285000 [Rhododendron molle]
MGPWDHPNLLSPCYQECCPAPPSGLPPIISGSPKGRLVSADSLLKLVSELKQTAIFSGFASLNDHVEQRIDEFNQQAEKTDRLLAKIGEEAAASLKELESHYYSSALRTSQLHQP